MSTDTINRRRFLGLLAGAAGTLPSQRTALADARASRRPNVILIMVDDCSAKEYACYGHATHQTPNLDALAKSGVMFETCWCTPICSPSRAMIMTGRYGFRTRWYHNDMKPRQGERGYNLAEDNLTIGELMKDAGYATAIVGKWQLRGNEAEHGFDEYCMWWAIKGTFQGPIEPPEGNLPGRAARYWHPAIVRNGEQLQTTERDYGPDLFVDFINDFAKRHRDGPFFVYYPMCLTHITWDFDLKRMGYVAPPGLDENGRRTGRKGGPTLQANVEYVDHLIGRLVKDLEQLGLRDNTIVMFTCDNGTARYGKGVTSGERGPLVPMIVNCPGIVKPIGASGELVDFSDVLPTLADFAGAQLPADYVIDGRSFGPILRGEAGPTREWIFSNYADRRLMRDKRWLLDGDGRLWDCGDDRSGEGYRDVTDSNDREAITARRRFEEILKNLPAPDPNDPLLAAYTESRQRRKQKARAKQSRQKGGKQE